MKLQSKQKSITVRHIIKQNRIEIPEINSFFFFFGIGYGHGFLYVTQKP